MQGPQVPRCTPCIQRPFFGKNPLQSIQQNPLRFITRRCPLTYHGSIGRFHSGRGKHTDVRKYRTYTYPRARHWSRLSGAGCAVLRARHAEACAYSHHTNYMGFTWVAVSRVTHRSMMAVAKAHRLIHAPRIGGNRCPWWNANRMSKGVTHRAVRCWI